MSYNESILQSQAALRDLQAITMNRIFPLLLETFLMAVFTCLIVYFVCQQLSQRSTPLKGRLSAPGVALILYAFAVVYWALDIRILWLELSRIIPLELDPTQDLNIRAALLANHGVLLFAQNIFCLCIFTLNDLITLWRAYVLFGSPRWLLCTSVLMILVELGLYALNIVSEANYLPDVPRSTLSLADSLIKGVGPAAYACTAAGQVFASVLVVRRIWVSWDDFKDLLFLRGSKRRPSELCVLVAESGLLYAILWVWVAISISGISGLLTAAYWSNYYMVPIAAIYPTAIVVIVTLRRSVLEQTFAPDTNALSTVLFVGPTSMATASRELRSAYDTPHDTQQGVTGLSIELDARIREPIAEDDEKGSTLGSNGKAII
ncbi:hypothetical protein PENSPDRAFT_510649 [Peniophora sp. CONT]|nr:hypothetical protein PENSPDRAFT_510649 [Peniophora sp. CONT]